MRNVPLSELMTPDVIFANQNDTVSSVEEKFRAHRIRHIPIVDDDKKLVGIITYRDLLSYTHPNHTDSGWIFDAGEMNQFILKHIMTHEPVTLRVDNTIADAVEIMARERYGCIPVVNKEGDLVGIVTQVDVLKWLGKKLSDERIL